jgi:hypothetical protein
MKVSQRIVFAGIPSLGLLALAASLSLTAPAVAQSMHGARPGGGSSDVTHEPPPPALPGAQSAPDMVAPADKTAGDMLPTDALFDAIHRGDIVAARDALSRGADLEGRNVLGQTPLDLSIDLNRNDITFLLLSMRTPPNTEGVPTPQVAEPSAPAPQAVAQSSAAPAPATTSTHHGRLAHTNAPTGIVPVAVHAPQTPPRRFASSGGGAPNPQSGFLGFDTSH